eukprot:3932512-Rhodomonas_salina.1
MTNEHCVEIGVGDSVLFRRDSSADEFGFSVGIVKALTVTLGAEDEDLFANCLLHAVLQTDKTVSVSINVITEKVLLVPTCFWEKAWGYMAGYFVIDCHLVQRDCLEMHVACITSPAVRARWASLAPVDTTMGRESIR